LHRFVPAVVLVLFSGAVPKDLTRFSCTAVGPKQVLAADPVSRPVPVASLPGADVPKALGLITKVLENQHFRPTGMVTTQGQIEAVRDVTNGQDRVLIWIERDLEQPTQQFQVYLSFGLYQEFWGATDMLPVRLSAPAIGRLRVLQAAIATSASHQVGVFK
jgi:hypothetical protein